MKKSLLLALILLVLSSSLALSADRRWNFRNWSATTLSNLMADTVTNWKYESTTRFSNRAAITAGSSLYASNVAIAETKGLTFGAMAAAKLRIDFNTNPGRLMLNGNPLVINVPDCLVGDTITVVTMTDNSTTARGITASANCTRLSGAGTSVDSIYNVFLVTTAGTASFTTTGGLHFREIKVVNDKNPFWVKDTTAFIPNAEYFYAISGFDGTKPEESWLAQSTMKFAYDNGGTMAVETVTDSTAAKYYWDIDTTTSSTAFTIKNVVTGLSMGTGSIDYAAIALSSTPTTYAIKDFRTAYPKGTTIKWSTSGQPYASYMPFGFIYNSNRTLCHGYFVRNLSLYRSDCVSFLYAYPKVSVYRQLLDEVLPEAKAMAARTITEGTGLLNYPSGMGAYLDAAIATAQTAYDGTEWSAMETALPVLTTAVDSFKAAVIIPSEKYFLSSGTDYVGLLNDSTLQMVSNVDSAAMLNGSKNTAGEIELSYGTNYVAANGTLTATATSYEAVVDNNQVQFISGTDTLAVDSVSTFSMAVVVIPLQPQLKSTTPVNGATSADTSDIKIEFDQNIQILDASKITINGVQATATVSEKTLTISDPLIIKTNYVVRVDSGAIAHADKATLVADTVIISFKTFSPYLRDKQTMLGTGTFSGVYALFGEGSANGYTNTSRQIAGNANDSLWCGLSNALASQWYLELADTANCVWNVKNYATGKYLAWSVDSNLVVSATPAGWQISFNTNAGATDYEATYTFWPSVTDADGFYDLAIRVDSMQLKKTVVSGSIASSVFRICPMSSLTYANISNYTGTSYVKLGARNVGSIANQITGDNSIYWGTATTDEGGQWKVTRQANGRYVFQNRLTGQYLTYMTDSTVLGSATYTPGSDDQEWVIMFHCSRSNVNYYTMQGRSRVLYGYATSGLLSVTQRNAYNGTAGYARMCLIASGVTYVAGEGKPTVSVPSVSSKSVTLSWDANKEANRYIVRVADTCNFVNGDSIGWNAEDSLIIYEQIPSTLNDSDCLVLDTISDLTYKATGLTPQTTYYCTVQAMDSTGLLGVVSDVTVAQTVTMDKFKPAAPVVGTIEMKSVAMSWLANEEATGYALSYWTNESDLKTINTTDNSCTITGLLANTTVYAYLSLKADTLTSLSSDTVNATTLAYSTSTMSNAKTKFVTDSSMTIFWNSATDAVSYNLYFTNIITQLTTVAPINVADTFYVMSGLNANTNYFMQLAAVDVASVISKKSGTTTKKTNKTGIVNVGYITLQKTMDATADSVQNDPIYRVLKADAKLNVTLNVLTDQSATAVFDQTPYNILIIQESMGGNAGILMPGKSLGLANLELPTLYNKTYAFKAGRALATGATGGGAESTAGVYSITVDAANQSNPLFSNIVFKNDTIGLFTGGATDLGATGTKALNMANSVANISGTMLGYPTGSSTTTICVNDIPAGDTIGTEPIKVRIITMGMNFGALCRLNGANITADNYTLWKNAVYVLAGFNIEVGINHVVASSVDVYPNPTSDYLNIRGLNTNSTIRVYNTTGQLMMVEKSDNETMSLDLSKCNAGLYLLQVESNGKSAMTKIIKK